MIGQRALFLFFCFLTIVQVSTEIIVKKLFSFYYNSLQIEAFTLNFPKFDESFEKDKETATTKATSDTDEGPQIMDEEMLKKEMEKAFLLVNDIFKDLRVLLEEVQSTENVMRDQQHQLEMTLHEALGM